MQHEFSLYPKAKRFFQNLAAQGEKVSIEILQDYEDLIAQGKDFLAARYLKEIYVDFNVNWKE